MSDSDSDGILSNNVFTFQNASTIVSAKGPNINMNLTGRSFRNNVFSSTMQLPRPNGRPRYPESAYDQQSISRKRMLSPMSVRSACNMRQRNDSYSFNLQGMAAPRSAINGRSGSPMSVRSINTTTSVSAFDITNALKNEHFSTQELKIINDALNKQFIRRGVRNKIDNRRYRKYQRRKRTGYDSGEQGSDSSLSSDDRSRKTSSYRDITSSCRSTITDISNFKSKLTTNMSKGCTDYLKHNPVHNVGGPANLSITQTSISSHQSLPIPANFNMTKKPIAPAMQSLKDRFKSGYLLPSQRFNRSVIPTSIPESIEKEDRNEIIPQNELLNKNSGRSIDTDSEEEIFSNVTVQNPSNNRKRSIDSEDILLPNQKRIKTLSSCKNYKEVRILKANNGKANDFVFAKPTCPAKKTIKEQLISKSAAPLSDTIPQLLITPPEIQQPRNKNPVEEDNEKLENEQSDSTINATNVSMRPSFIKRKLFSQKQVAEKINLSTDNLNSPHNVNYGIQKEKHKTRKLQQAKTQSYLSRDIQQDENDLKDLINKIAPLDQMNVTNWTNRTVSQFKNTTEEDNDECDMIYTVSTSKNDDNVSETYTDEEILNSTIKELQKVDNSKHTTHEREDKANKITLNTCKILLEKLPSNIKHFWDTDFESDAEFQPSSKTDKVKSKENCKPDLLLPKEAPKTQGCSSMFHSKKPTTASATLATSQNYTFDSTKKFDSTLRIMSHRAPKRNKLDRTADEDAKSVVLESESKRVKNHASSFTMISNRKPEALIKVKSKKSKETTKKDNKKSPKGKQAAKTKEQNQSTLKSNGKIEDTNKTEGQANNKDMNGKKTPLKLNSSKQVENTQTKKLSNTNKKLVETKVLKNKSPKTKTTKKLTQENNSSTIEVNNNSDRAMRSCRIKSKNQTADKSNLDLDKTMNRSLRSQKLDLHSAVKKNNLKATQKDSTNNKTSRLSDVSFSLGAKENIVAKRAVTKITNSHVFNVDESDVSFSLTPTPKRVRAGITSRNNTTNLTPLRRSNRHTKDLPILNITTNRQRIPNKRYVY